MMTAPTKHRDTLDWIEDVLALLDEAIGVIGRANAHEASLEARMTLAAAITALRTDLVRERALLSGARGA